MNRTWVNHIVSFTLVTLILSSLVLYFNYQQKNTQMQKQNAARQWLNMTYLDFDIPLHKAILEESLNIFDPENKEKHAGQIAAIEQLRQKQVIDATTTNYNGPITSNQFSNILLMYLKFIFVYVITLILTYYGVQTLGVYRFVREKQLVGSNTNEIFLLIKKYKIKMGLNEFWKRYSRLVLNLFKAFFKGIAYLILFSPAYVLAYSFRTRFDTDTILFMILLGVISNALLITYTHKFYTFLVGESRKGYVETAIVKNMYQSYSGKKGISSKMMLNFRKRFTGHVFDHIYENARFQYLATIKEQASFLITGLIIIEMALNIQDHLCYELLQNILFKNYAVVTLIILGIYYVVKLTNAGIDWLIEEENKRYNNII